MKTTAKKILQEVVCRYGVPETIESDRGTHFTGEDLQQVMKELGVEQAFHTPYHPQSSGKDEWYPQIENAENYGRNREALD